MTTVSLTLAALRRAGYTAAKCEYWNAFAQVRCDLWGLDVLACRPGEVGCLGVQCTDHTHVADRLAKLQRLPEIAVFLAAENKVEVWGWRKVKGRWFVRKVRLQAEDMAGVEVQALPRKRRLRKGERQAELFDQNRA